MRRYLSSDSSCRKETLEKRQLKSFTISSLSFDIKKVILWSPVILIRSWKQMLFQKVHWLFYKRFCAKCYKRNITLSGLLVCRLIKSLTETLSSKLSHSPSKLRFSVKFSRTFSVYIPATRRVFFTKYIQIHIYVSDSFFQYQEGKYLALYPLSTNPAGDIFK